MMSCKKKNMSMARRWRDWLSICVLAGLVAGPVVCVGAAEIEWIGEDGFLPEDANLGFIQSASANASLTMGDGALVMEAPSDGGVSVEFPIQLAEPGARLVVEVEARSEADRDAAAIKIMSGSNGVSTWLFEESQFRIQMGHESTSKYVPVMTGDRHEYRYEIEGTSVQISIDGRMVFSGELESPLESARLVIGNVSPGGGLMEIYRIAISYPDSGVGATQGRRDERSSNGELLVWDFPGDQAAIEIAEWPGEADALVIEASYQAASARQCQWYFLCEGGFGRQVVVEANRLASIAESDYRTERFLVTIPDGTDRISIRRSVADSAVPFVLRSFKATPVEILTENTAYERTSILRNTPIGQSFEVADGRRILGIAIPLRRNFDHRRVPSHLVCRVSASGVDIVDWSIAAGEIAAEFDSIAIFMDGESRAVGGGARFDLESGIAETRFFGWYNYDLSWNDPYPGGNAYLGDRAETGSDITFFVLSGIHQG